MIYTVTLNPSLDRTMTVPHLVYDEMVRATSLRFDWGGKGFNVSRGLQVLGTESIALGLTGGATGQTLQRGLRGLGIITDLVPGSGETRANTVIIEADTGRYVKVNEPGPTVRPREKAAFLDRVSGYLSGRDPRGDLWVFSGSLPPGLPDGFYADLIGIVQAAGARTLLDASGEPLRLGCAAAPFLVKPNVAEAIGFAQSSGLPIPELSSVGGDLADAATLTLAHPFLALGIELVALSLGAGGLLLASAAGGVRAMPPQVRAHNPVGAGDALLAGVTWALEAGLSLEEMARWGVAMGTAAAMGEGVSVVVGAEVGAVREQVTVHAVL